VVEWQRIHVSNIYQWSYCEIYIAYNCLTLLKSLTKFNRQPTKWSTRVKQSSHKTDTIYRRIMHRHKYSNTVISEQVSASCQGLNPVSPLWWARRADHNIPLHPSIHVFCWPIIWWWNKVIHCYVGLRAVTFWDSPDFWPSIDSELLYYGSLA